MLKSLMINVVSHSISIETKNHASPNVTSANGSVMRRMIGFRIVFRIPNTTAAQMIVQFEPSFVTPLSIQVATASTIAFVVQESRSQTITRQKIPPASDGTRRQWHPPTQPAPSSVRGAASVVIAEKGKQLACGGGGGIRTHGTLARPTVFKQDVARLAQRC